MYASLHFPAQEIIDPQVFSFAFHGYQRLREAGKLLRPELLTIVDYSLSANTRRLWVIDLVRRCVLYNIHVAHGQGTGDEFAEHFSNRENSHQTSLGFYTTGDTYQGEHGLSLHLHGQDEGFNDAAFSRSIVLHGAAYVSESFIAAHKRLGRSWGCPAVATDLAPKLIRLLQEGTCMFLYYPDASYLSASQWLKKSAKQNALAGMLLPQNNKIEQESRP
ncbi:murein L,D-transpeptidase catalytic domain family protein [Rurimicrobium arvi]|uniref:Murein L,D-transpeptidase catalytic domain family protein n=1 Tax=Rurimicrobium arvi TaxID=2049916 RepID=A0ABP8MVH0_9BACT